MLAVFTNSGHAPSSHTRVDGFFETPLACGAGFIHKRYSQRIVVQKEFRYLPFQLSILQLKVEQPLCLQGVVV